MPNYYAHLEFGRHVLESLPLPLRRSIEREKTAFLLGLLGPDPLFFCPVPPGCPRRLGMEMHRQSLRPVAERLRWAMKENQPQATGYAAGFLCHFVLDSACHGDVDAWSEEGPLTHAAIEAEMDRTLMLQMGLDPMRDTPIPPLLPVEVLHKIIPVVYPKVSLRQYRWGYGCFCRVSRLLTLAHGTFWRRVVDWVARTIPGCAPIRGMVLTKEPDAESTAHSRILLAELSAAIPAAVTALEFFFSAAPLDGWYDRDFHGRPSETPLPHKLTPAAAQC